MRRKKIKTPWKVLWDCSEGWCLLTAWRGPGPFSWGRTREFSASAGFPQQGRGQDPIWHLFRRVEGRFQQVERMSSFLLTLVLFLEWREGSGIPLNIERVWGLQEPEMVSEGWPRGGPGVAGRGAGGDGKLLLAVMTHFGCGVRRFYFGDLRRKAPSLIRSLLNSPKESTSTDLRRNSSPSPRP